MALGFRRCCSFLILFITLLGCGEKPTDSAATLKGVESISSGKMKVPRNVVLLIGDGMGPQQVALLKLFVERSIAAKQAHRHSSLIEMLETGSRGIVFPWSYDGIVVDSACATSQLATGSLCRSESLGVNEDGAAVLSIAERARNAGKSVGLVTDTRITHATPAAFGAHQLHRSSENAIAVDLIKSGFEVLLGGGMRHFVPSNPKNVTSIRELVAAEPSARALIGRSKRTDERNLLLEAQQAGYRLVFDHTQLATVEAPKVLGVFSESGMADGIAALQLQGIPERTEPSLTEMTLAALRLLERDEDGFFLMIEGGQIDWAAHQNDAGLLLHELLKFDDAITAVRKWASERDDTLVILTADHETGSFGFSYSAHQVPEPERIPDTAFADTAFQPRYNFVASGRLDQLFRQKSSLFTVNQQFSNLPKDKQTTASLRELLFSATEMKLTDHDAADILTSAPNPYFYEDHDELNRPVGPKMGDSAAFYPDIEHNRIILIARKLAPHQGVVWGTGTHTSTPVFVVASGVQAERFNGVFHTAELGRLLQDVSGLRISDK
jgi:alkaline phosphatase